VPLQGTSQFYILMMGAVAMLMGHVARCRFRERNDRMMSPLTVFGQGTRWARKQRSWLAMAAWALTASGIALCFMGLLNACAAG